MTEMIWTKLGIRVQAIGKGLLTSHAMLPTPLLMKNKIRVFYSACDRELRGRIYYVDLSRKFPFPVRDMSLKPCLDIGAVGTFDCDGVNPSCIIRLDDGSLRLYYIGWQRVSPEIPYTLIAGIAISKDEGVSFQRIGGPVLPPTQEEPFFRTAPFVWQEAESWQMLYIGGSRFFDSPTGKRLPLYSLCHARSDDGITWVAGDSALIEPDFSNREIGFGRPVLNGRQLLISLRTIDGYRQKQAPWPLPSGTIQLHDALEPGPEAWDDDMTCFGTCLGVDDYKVLFYNGNGFGRTGFGLAYKLGDNMM